MTRSRYAVAAFFQSFGITRNNKRLADAAFELHLMQDGEQLLGAACWSKTEEIEEISMEYWNLRRMERQEKELLEKLSGAENTLHEAQINRAEMLDRSKGAGEELLGQRDEIFAKIEDLSDEREEILANAKTIKRRHAALKMKAEVLREEDNDTSKLTECSIGLAALKDEFAQSKSDLDEVEARISTEEDILAELQDKIKIKTNGSKGESAKSFSRISKANRDITAFRSELGLLNEEQAKIFREIGRFLNLNAKRHDCRDACKGYRGLLEQTRLLYNSVQMNRKLANRE